MAVVRPFRLLLLPLALAALVPTAGAQVSNKPIARAAQPRVMTAMAATASPDPSLVAAYSFDDVVGSSVTDDSANGTLGTISGASLVPGHSGSALSFNGTSSWLTVPDSSALDLSSAMTLEAWVEPTAAQGTARRFIVGKEGTGELAYGLYSNTGMSTPAGGLSLNGGGAGEQIARGPTMLPVGSWSHLAVTYDGATVSLYVNGTDVADVPATGNIDATTGALRIGGNSVLGEYFNGLIDDLRVYNRPLSATEIQTDMSTPVPLLNQLPGLAAAYSFDEGVGTSAIDDSGNGNLGTISAASWVPGHTGSAVSFNGTSSWVTVADSPSLDLSSGMTLEAWVDPSAPQTAR